MIARRLAIARIALVVSLALGGCRDRVAEERARVEAADARDRAELARAVESDQQVDRAMKEADDASRAGDDARAAQILETKAAPAADAAIASAAAHPVETAWGRARMEALLGVLKERRAAIPRYVTALRGEDLDAKLAAVEEQIALQKRAIVAASSALAGPGDASIP